MANFEVCYEWMMDNEDAGRNYEKVSDDPPGAFAISGINSAKFPTQFARIDALPQSQRAAAVHTFYEATFWNRWYAQLIADEVAKRVYDAAVNMGPATAARLLQQAAGAEQDGAWGPLTVAAANGHDPDALVTAFKTARVNHYKAIVDANPLRQGMLKAWLARAMK